MNDTRSDELTTKRDDPGDLLELPRVAVLATYRRDGTVLLSPVWHEWRDTASTS